MPEMKENIKRNKRYSSPPTNKKIKVDINKPPPAPVPPRRSATTNNLFKLNVTPFQL